MRKRYEGVRWVSIEVSRFKNSKNNSQTTNFANLVRNNKIPIHIMDIRASETLIHLGVATTKKMDAQNHTNMLHNPGQYYNHM